MRNCSSSDRSFHRFSHRYPHNWSASKRVAFSAGRSCATGSLIVCSCSCSCCSHTSPRYHAGPTVADVKVPKSTGRGQFDQNQVEPGTSTQPQMKMRSPLLRTSKQNRHQSGRCRRRRRGRSMPTGCGRSGNGPPPRRPGTSGGPRIRRAGVVVAVPEFFRPLRLEDTEQFERPGRRTLSADEFEGNGRLPAAPVQQGDDGPLRFSRRRVSGAASWEARRFTASGAGTP